MTAVLVRAVFLATISAICSIVLAQSPREQLQQMVEQVHASPNDHALRERIIRLGAQIKPAPAIPEEANRREGRAKFAFRSAKSNDDFLAAAAEFEAAARAAPWVAGYYSDLCTVYEKAEKYAEAKRNCELFLAGSTEPSLVSEIKQRIAGLEYGIEKAAKPKPESPRLAGTWLRVDAQSDPRDWQGLRARSRYPENAYHRYRFVAQGDDKAALYMDQHGGKHDLRLDGFWTDAYLGTRTVSDWQWRMRVATGQCGDNQVFRPVAFEVLEQGNIIRTKTYGLLKETDFDRKSQSGELSLHRRQGRPITPGPGGCFVVEFPAMFVRVGD